MQQFYLGVDVSKKTLAVYLMDMADNRVWNSDQLTNDEEGFRSLLSESLKHAKRRSSTELFQIAVGMESTGVYGERLCTYLQKHRANDRIDVYVLKPAAVKSFGEVMGVPNKNDRVDSCVIANYLKMAIAKGTERVFRAPSPQCMLLRGLCRRRQQLVKLQTSEKNRLEKCRYAATYPECLVQSVKNHIEQLNDMIVAIEREIKKVIRSDVALHKEIRLLQTIPGIGEVSSAIIVSETKGLLSFKNKKALVSYTGIAPKEHTSGSSVHKQSKISRRGNRKIRHALYMPVLSAIRHNPVIKDYYTKLQKQGKAKKVARVACMRKLLHIAWGVCTSQQPFDLAHKD